MFDVHSIEFYVIALFVAFALLGLIVGHREPGPATSDIVELVLTAEEGTTGTPMLTLQSQPDLFLIEFHFFFKLVRLNRYMQHFHNSTSQSYY